MLLASIAIGVVIVALLWDLAAAAGRARPCERHRARRAIVPSTAYDPGRERRAEQRARELLRSCVNDEEWSMYRDLGFIRVWGAMAQAPKRPGRPDDPRPARRTRTSIYPHKPIVAYLPQTRELLNEYCVAFPDETRPYGSARLPDSDDVLAKWMALTGDERRLIATANMHLPGPAGRPQAGPPRPLAPRASGSASGSGARSGRKVVFPRRDLRRERLRPQAPQPGPHRGARRAPPRAPS